MTPPSNYINNSSQQNIAQNQLEMVDTGCIDRMDE